MCLTQTELLTKHIIIAFILYRQHYQAQVIAQNPGLSNPEISKIIGEQWRCQTPEVKNDWKRLAEVYWNYNKFHVHVMLGLINSCKGREATPPTTIP